MKFWIGFGQLNWILFSIDLLLHGKFDTNSVKFGTKSAQIRLKIVTNLAENQLKIGILFEIWHFTWNFITFWFFQKEKSIKKFQKVEFSLTINFPINSAVARSKSSGFNLHWKCCGFFCYRACMRFIYDQWNALLTQYHSKKNPLSIHSTNRHD